MIVDLPALVGKYRTKGILLDSNLLVLFFVGSVAPELVENFKRTRNQGFTGEEFSLLQHIIKAVSRVATTPHILTETSNFVCQLQGKARQTALQVIAQAVQNFKERRAESKKLVQSNAFFSFGLTDCAILDLPPKKYLVLSVDAALVRNLQKRGIDAINFNHLRQQGWQQG